MKKQIEKALGVQIQSALKSISQAQNDYKKASQEKIKRQLRLGIS